MSVYNGEALLSKSIESILNQSFKQFEFIIVNDGSTDNSHKIIHDYQKKDNRIIIINKKNTGLADSLNTGLRESNTDWIARIDADDICKFDRLKEQYLFIKNNPSTVLLGSNAKLIDLNGNSIGFLKYPTDHQKILKKLSITPETFPHSSVLYNRHTALKVGGYRSKITYAEDLDLWLRLSKEGNVACLDKCLVQIRIHPNQISHHDSGDTQYVDAHVAMVSYWYDKLFLESIFNLSVLSFEDVKSEVYQYLKNNNHLLYQRRLAKFKEDFNSNHSLRVFLYFCIFDIKVLLWAFRRKYFYPNFAIEIAKKVHKKNIL